jgi:hypothetical protein
MKCFHEPNNVYFRLMLHPKLILFQIRTFLAFIVATLLLLERREERKKGKKENPTEKNRELLFTLKKTTIPPAKEKEISSISKPMTTTFTSMHLAPALPHRDELILEEGIHENDADEFCLYRQDACLEFDVKTTAQRSSSEEMANPLAIHYDPQAKNHHQQNSNHHSECSCSCGLLRAAQSLSVEGDDHATFDEGTPKGQREDSDCSDDFGREYGAATDCDDAEDASHDEAAQDGKADGEQTTCCRKLTLDNDKILRPTPRSVHTNPHLVADDQETSFEVGSPAIDNGTFTAMTSEDSITSPEIPATPPSLSTSDSTRSNVFIDHEAFLAMVQAQAAQRKEAAAQRKAEWVASMQTDLQRSIPPALRLPGLVAEAKRFELLQLKKLQTSDNRFEGMTGAQRRQLCDDIRRSYASLLREVNRAVRSEPPITAEGQTTVPVEIHQQNVADQGVQCFASLLPFSDGVCGALGDARRWQLQAAGRQEPCHELHVVPSSPNQVTRGHVVGKTGRLIPLSLSACHGKPDKVAALRRRELQRVTAPPPATARAVTPIFARTPRPSYRPSPIVVVGVQHPQQPHHTMSGTQPMEANPNRNY